VCVCNVEENTTLGIAVSSAKLDSSGVRRLDISAANPDISRYVVAPIRAVLLPLLEPAQVFGSLHTPESRPALGGPVPVEGGDEVRHQARHRSSFLQKRE